MDTFERVKNSIEKTPWIALFFSMYVVAFIIACGLLWEDFQTNFAFMGMIPTQKVGKDYVVNFMAILLQLSPVLFSYTFLRGVKPRVTGAIALFALLTDWFMGLWFRSNGWTMGNWNYYAVVEDFLFFTVGSEILFGFSLGMTMATLPLVVDQFIHAVKSLMASDGGKPQGKMPQNGKHSNKPNYAPPNLPPIQRPNNNNRPSLDEREMIREFPRNNGKKKEAIPHQFDDFEE